MIQIRQAELIHEPSSTTMITWLPMFYNRRMIQEGMIISVDDTGDKWIIKKLYETHSTLEEIRRKWNVGGL